MCPSAYCDQFGERDNGSSQARECSDEILTPKGKEKREEVVKDVHLRDFIIETEENEDHVRCKVKKNLASHVWRMTTFPIEDVNGSRFGTCTSGSPRMMGVPCMHMVVALKSGSVEVSTIITSYQRGGCPPRYIFNTLLTWKSKQTWILPC